MIKLILKENDIKIIKLVNMLPMYTAVPIQMVIMLMNLIS